jgi:trimethylamine--corrinoid protein Co-methyltransferase
MSQSFRPALTVAPTRRLDDRRIEQIAGASLALLDDPGVLCYNEQAADIYRQAGCRVEPQDGKSPFWRVRFPAGVVKAALESVPSEVVLGARNPANRLKLNAHRADVYFGTGSEANIVLESELRKFSATDDSETVITHPGYRQERGSIGGLCRSAKLCNALGQVDFFIRNVNIQDDGIEPANKDVNVFLASLMYMTKHVQAGLVDLERLDDVLRLAELAAGGREALENNPIISFITCTIKSPLQMVEDTTEKLIAIAGRGLPVVISSSPQGGSTAPIVEEGIVALINAEILAGITLTQLVRKGTPVLYGAVPVRARLDTLHDHYGAPEFIHYNIDCIQMARHYGIPCYSSAGVGDARVPGLQATVEKLFAQLEVASAGAQYIHYAFGLLDKTNVFSPLQAVLDDAHIGIIKGVLRQPVFDGQAVEKAVEQIRQVTASPGRLFARYIRRASRRGLVSPPYPFESGEDRDEVLPRAQQALEELMRGPDERLDEATVDVIFKEVPGLLDKKRFEL